MKIFGKQKLIHPLYNVRFSPANPLLLHFFVWVFLRFIRFVSSQGKISSQSLRDIEKQEITIKFT